MQIPIRILIVEDSEADTHLLMSEVQKGGFAPEFERVETADAMKAALSAKPWDIVIADHNMPSFSGLDALRLLRASEQDLPFILVSGAISDNVAVEAMHAGAQDYVLKDNLGRLLPAIKRELQESLTRRERRYIEQMLRESEERCRRLVELSPWAIFTQCDGKFVFFNHASLKLFAAAEEDLLGKSVLSFIHPDYRGEVQRQFDDVISSHKELSFIRVAILRLDGSLLEGEIAAVPFSFNGSAAVLAVMRDKTQRKQSYPEVRQPDNELDAHLVAGTTKLEIAKATLEKTIAERVSTDQESIGRLKLERKEGLQKKTLLVQLVQVVVISVLGLTLYETTKQLLFPKISIWQSHAMTIAFGSLIAGVAALYILRHWHSLYKRIIKENTERARAEAEVLSANQQLETAVVQRTNQLKSTNEQLLLELAERQRTEEQLFSLAHYDVLTNLANRILFNDRLKQAIGQARRSRGLVAVLLIDLDRFKEINDSFGHGTGDQLLQQAAIRLVGSVREGDTVARLGGDEFAIVLSSLRSPQDAGVVAEKILTGVSAPFILDGHESFVTASIGITLYPTDSELPEGLLKNADTAMYRSKEAGKNRYQFYAPSMHVVALKRLKLENELRHALERQEFVLYYQPKVQLRNQEVTGLEALLRWQQPQHGLVPPSEFITVLEDTGLIIQVGEWVVRSACAQLAAWQKVIKTRLPIAVNLSPRQFHSPNIVKMVTSALDEYHVDSNLLELEITESLIMQNTDASIHVMSELRSLGIGLAMDDFGTGFSSLSYLRRFPLDILKIDKSFVNEIVTNKKDAAVVQAVIVMADNLGMKTIAEGVETQEQATRLLELGCEYAQGYYFGKPVSAVEIIHRLV